MSEALLIALISFAVKYGIPACIAFFQNRGTTVDEAIAALGLAHEKSLEEYIRLDAEAAAKLIRVNPEAFAKMVSHDPEAIAKLKALVLPAPAA